MIISTQSTLIRILRLWDPSALHFVLFVFQRMFLSHMSAETSRVSGRVITEVTGQSDTLMDIQMSSKLLPRSERFATEITVVARDRMRLSYVHFVIPIPH